MGRKKQELYRICDISTGLYYNGGQTKSKVNPKFDGRYTVPSWDKRPIDWSSGQHPWNYWYKDYWDTTGKLFTNYKGAEQAVSRLTKTNKKLRANKTENILFGNKESNNYKIIKCRIINVKEKEEKK